MLQKKTEITNEEILKVKEILAKMPRKKNHKGEKLPQIRYETREIGNDDKENSDYQYITYEEKQFLNKFLPSGDYNYLGIHTIKNVSIVQEIETLL